MHKKRVPLVIYTGDGRQVIGEAEVLADGRVSMQVDERTSRILFGDMAEFGLNLIPAVPASSISEFNADGLLDDVAWRHIDREVRYKEWLGSTATFKQEREGNFPVPEELRESMRRTEENLDG